MDDKPTDNLTPPTKKKRHGCLKGCLVVFILFLALIIGGILVKGDWRSDASILKNYQPSPLLADITLKDTMTDKSKALLYRTDPQFVDGKTFQAICSADGIEGLACTNTQKTTFLQIDDPMFSDHNYSAAAHEMLHVAYSKLKTDEKTRVNVLLDQELTRHQDDAHLTSIIDMLKTKKAGDTETMKSELHSKFAVEYADLVPALDDYYKQYFVDRQQVVKLYQNGGYDSRVRRIDQLNAEGLALEAKINALDSTLRSLQAAGVTDVDGFNAKVNQINSMIRQYNAKAAESKKLFAEVEKFYRYFNPNYQPPTQKAEQ